MNLDLQRMYRALNAASKYSIPKYLYHVTSGENTKLIQQEGLRPKSYFVEDPALIKGFIHPDNNPLLLRVPTENIKFREVPDRASWVNMETITPDQIEVVSFQETQKRTATLTQRHNDNTDREEWALVSKSSGKVLKWFGTSRPSDEAVAKEERRVQYFKHAG